jgi:hypothetical protein
MSDSGIKKIIRAAVLMLPIAFLPAAALSQEQPCSTDKVFTVVHDLLWAAYPEIFIKERYIHLETGRPLDSSWAKTYGVKFKVVRFSPGVSFDPTFDATGKLIPPPENTTFLWGSFWFDKTGQVIQVEIEGDLARSKENKAARAFVESHPQSADEAMMQALKQNGAKYGSTNRKAFLTSLHLERFQKIFGQIQMKSVEFRDFTTPEHRGSFALLFWSVKLESHQPDGTDESYALTFEPFEGKLVGIIRMWR